MFESKIQKMSLQPLFESLKNNRKQIVLYLYTVLLYSSLSIPHNTHVYMYIYLP